MPGLFAATVSWVQAIVGLGALIFVALGIGCVAYFSAPVDQSSSQRFRRTLYSVLFLTLPGVFLGFLACAAVVTMLLGDVGPLVIRGSFPGWLGLIICE
jgi:NO-binding membrane sensor protein with MHYT domain